MSLAIREATLEDAQGYAVCLISSWRSAYKGIVPDEYLDSLSVDQRTELMKQNINAPNGLRYCCATCGDIIIGVLLVGQCRDEDKPNAGEIYAIYLLAAYWGKGFGKELMRYAIETLKRISYCEAIVWVLEENVRARQFYEKHGFALDGAKQEIVLVKPLTAVRYVMDI